MSDDQTWMEMALYWTSKVVGEPGFTTGGFVTEAAAQRARREKRMQRVLAPFRMTDELRGDAGEYSTAVAFWVDQAPDHIQDLITKPVRDELGQFTLLAKERLHVSDSMSWLKDYFTRHPLKIEPVMESGGIVLKPESATLIDTLKASWFEFCQAPYPVYSCEHCAKIFKPKRADALFCSVSCRSNSKKTRDRHEQKQQ